MTTIDLYRKHKAGEISREKFLYEVRRDPNLSTFLTNLTSYDDAVKILKNKGIVTEADMPTRQLTGDEDADWMGEAKAEKDIEIDIDSAEQITLKGKELDSEKLGTDKKYRDIILKAPDKVFMYKGKPVSITAVDLNDGSVDEPKIYLTVLNESDTKEAKADEAVKAEVKPKAPTTKKLKTLHLDVAHPYEYRLGLQQELNTLGEYTDEAFSKAKIKVLKNLAKDANFYTTLLNAKTSPYTFKKTETDEKGMQARSDGHMKKEAKKDEKANVKDNLGNKEAGTTKPKGIKIMPDKGVTGSSKTIKEGLEELKKKVINKYVTVDVEDDGEEYPMLNKTAVANYLKSVIDPSEIKSVNVFMRDDEGFDESASYFFEDEYVDTTEQEVEDWAKQEMSYYLFSKPDEFPSKENMEEGSFMGGVDLGSSFEKMKSMDQGNSTVEKELEDALKSHDWYYMMSDDPRAYNAGSDEKSKISSLMSKLPRQQAVDLYNSYCPKDWKLQKEDKHASLKEKLKQGLKELITPADVAAAKRSGKPINVSSTNTMDIASLKNAKANFTTYE